MTDIQFDGITEKTPDRVMLGAGTIYKNFAWNATDGKWEGDLLGATKGGNTLSIVPEIYNVEPDGAWVKVEGFQVKTGETATLEINALEFAKEIVKYGTLAEDGTSEATGYEMIQSKASIVKGDYIENLAFVGHKLDGGAIIVIFEIALCTSGVEIGSQNKEASVPAYTFENHAKLTGDHKKLPWRIYFPEEVATA